MKLQKNILCLLLTFIFNLSFCNEDFVKNWTLESPEGLSDIKFSEAGMSFLPTAKVKRSFYSEKRKQFLEWNPGERLFVEYGDSLALAQSFNIYSLTENRFVIVNTSARMHYPYSEEKKIFFLLDKRNGEIPCKKIGEYYIDHTKTEKRTTAAWMRFGIINNYANNRTILFEGKDHDFDTLTFDKNTIFLPRRVLENLKQYALVNGINNTNFSFLICTLGRSKNYNYFEIHAYIWNYLNKFFINGEFKNNHQIEEIKTTIPQIFPENLNTTDKAKETALKAFAGKYQSDEALKKNEKLKGIAKPDQFVCRVLKLKDNVEGFAAAGTEIWQVEMFDDKNSLICVAWINPFNNSDEAKSPDNAAALANAKPIIFILEPVQALIVKE